MKARKHETAEEFMARLEADPDYRERMRAKAERRVAEAAEIKKAEQPVLDALAERGEIVNSLSDYVNSDEPTPPAAVEVLLEWVLRVEQRTVLDMIVRALALTEQPYDGRPLAQLFETTKSYYDIRSVIGYTIQSACPENITEWVVATVQNRKYGGSRDILCWALIKMVPPERAIPILESIFDDLPAYAAGALGKVADAGMIDFLLGKRSMLKKKLAEFRKGTFPFNWTKATIEEVDKAIKTIEHRKKKRNA